MTYIIITTIQDTNGNENTTTTTTQAPNMQEARKQAQAAAGKKAQIRIYPTTTDAEGIQEGAKLIVRRTTANMVRREAGGKIKEGESLKRGTGSCSIQWELYHAIRASEIVHESALECINVAALALVEGVAAGLPADEQYHQAYLALNRYLRSIRAINLSVTARRTCYIEDIHGDIIDVGRHIGQIIREGAHYIPQAEDSMEGKREKLEALQAIIATLSPTQRKIAGYLAHPRGYSVRQICAAMGGRAPSTIQEHINAIRRKAHELFPAGVQ